LLSSTLTPGQRHAV